MLCHRASCVRWCARSSSVTLASTTWKCCAPLRSPTAMCLKHGPTASKTMTLMAANARGFTAVMRRHQPEESSMTQRRTTEVEGWQTDKELRKCACMIAYKTKKDDRPGPGWFVREYHSPVALANHLKGKKEWNHS